MSYEREVTVYMWLIRSLPTLFVIGFAVGVPLALWING